MTTVMQLSASYQAHRCLQNKIARTLHKQHLIHSRDDAFITNWLQLALLHLKLAELKTIRALSLSCLVTFV